MEVIVSLAILSTLLSLGVPAFSAVVRDARRWSLTSSLMTDLSLARTEAIKRGRRVVLCVSADGSSCASSGSWSHGRLVFEDANNNGWRDSGETLIHHESRVVDGWQIKGNRHVSRYISYHPMGRTLTLGGGFQVGTLTLCQPSSSPTMVTQIVISYSGRPRVNGQAIGNCDP